MQIVRSKDYIDEINKLFPDISRNDIKKIMDYGWRQLYLLNSYGGDVIIRNNTFWSYVGRLTYDSKKHFRYYCLKLAKRIRILYKRKKIQWDGYYYFALTEKQYQNYISQKKKRGRPKKNFKFENICLYKIYDECVVKQWGCKYIFKIPFPFEFGYCTYKKEYITDKAELIEIREVPKFKDILISNNNYNVLKK